MLTIKISSDFTDTPGGRYMSDGNFSGEEFRNRILAPQYARAAIRGEELLIDLDGVYGYSISFLEEAFGGLARKYGRFVGDIMMFKSEEEPDLIERIKSLITDAVEIERDEIKDEEDTCI